MSSVPFWMVLATATVMLLVAALAGAEHRNWKCKKRGPTRQEYCHIYRSGFKELKREMDDRPPPEWTRQQDFWRAPELRGWLHTEA